MNMRRKQTFNLARAAMTLLVILCSMTTRAENVVVLTETFDQNTSKGGRDGDFNNGSGTPVFDVSGWTGNNENKIFGANHCIRCGTGDTNGVLITPTITLTGTQVAMLTFSAAGWGDKGNTTNTLTVTVNNGSVTGDTNITLENAVWNDYTVYVVGTTSFQLTFTGRRGFLDDVLVTSITEVAAPTLTESATFWPTTTETPTKNITVTPAPNTLVRYTTDGTTPTTEHGTEVTLSTNFSVHTTTTVRAIAYVSTVTSQEVTKTYTVGQTVEGISEFKDLTDGTEVRLHLSPDQNARVLHGNDGKVAYLRDNSGTLCLDFGSTAAFNPTPQHNQHVAGWIVGRKQTTNDLLKLVATANTTTDYLALAAPVTEPATQPTEIPVNQNGTFNLSNNVGDWVTMSAVGIGENWGGTNITVNNTFQTANATTWDGALVDISGIVTASNTIAPVAYNNIKPIVYVIDENKEFFIPSSNIQHANVRLVRTLKAGIWNTFTLPFDIPSFNGEIRAYEDLNGNTMQFSEKEEIEAGRPYLVRPDDDIVNPEFNDVTLGNVPAFNIEYNDHSFVATYSPKDLQTDGTQLFLKSDGKLYYPSIDGKRIKGMRAYFEVPQGADVKVYVGEEDDETDIENVQWSMFNGQSDNIYDLSGRKINSPLKKPGIYIVNGKKIIIK
jgi:hypothetical protein